MQGSNELAKLIAATAKPRRQRAVATGHMRERIAVALRGAQPSHLQWFPNEAYLIFLGESAERRNFYEKWADRLLEHLDAHDLELIDRRHAE